MLKQMRLGFVLSGLMTATSAFADYPEKPIQVIMPWPPGNAVDVGSRAVIEAMSDELGVPMKVVSKPGGEGVIGTNELVVAKGDGYTIGAITVGPALSQIVAGNTPYEMEDLKPIGLFMTNPFILLTSSDAPYSNMSELASYTSNGDKHPILGHWGKAAVPTLAVFRMKAEKDFGVREITFSPVDSGLITSGDAEIVTALAGEALGSIKAGKTKALVAMTPKRISILPDLPTVSEQGFSFDASVWTGLFVPKSTPDEVVTKLEAALEKALSDQRVVEFSEKSGAVILFRSSAETSAQRSAEAEAYRAVMQSLGLLK